MALASAASAAVTFTVDSTLDQVDANVSDAVCSTAANTCTLRAAVMQANNLNSDVDILLGAATYNLTLLPSGANGADSGDLNVTNPGSILPRVSILGVSSALTILDASLLQDRALRVEADGFAVLTKLTIRNAHPPAGVDGAGIHNVGSLSLHRAVVSGNAANGHGGGIFSTNFLSVDASTILGNSAVADGGGIWNLGSFFAYDSTLSENFAGGDGGAIWTGSYTSLNQVTLAANRANGSGGGIHVTSVSAPPNVVINGSTIAINEADSDADPNGGSGAGLSIDAGTVTLRNALVAANNLSGAPIYEDCHGAVTLEGRSLLGTADGCTLTTTSGTWGLLNGFGFLGGLAKNGGPTATVALLPGSNAIDASDPAFPCVAYPNLPQPYDQRGAPRIRGARCDIGSYEEGTLFLDGFESGDRSNWSSTAP